MSSHLSLFFVRFRRHGSSAFELIEIHSIERWQVQKWHTSNILIRWRRQNGNILTDDRIWCLIFALFVHRQHFYSERWSSYVLLLTLFVDLRLMQMESIQKLIVDLKKKSDRWFYKKIWSLISNERSSSICLQIIRNALAKELIKWMKMYCVTREKYVENGQTHYLHYVKMVRDFMCQRQF